MSDSFSSWFRSFASCCGSRERPASSASSLGRNIVVLRDQPAVIPHPSAEPAWSNERTYEKTLERERQREREKATLWRPASRDSSARKNWFSGSSSSVRRLQISGPTDFRHLHSESFQFPPQQSPPQQSLPQQTPPQQSPPQQSRPRPRSFRPIELSIYQPHNRLSAILPHIECDITAPPRAHTASSSRWDASSGTTANDRSHSTMSFHVPRKHTRQESGMSNASMSPPRPLRSTMSHVSMSPPRPHRSAMSSASMSPPRPLRSTMSHANMSPPRPRNSSMSDASMTPPRIPPKSRARAYTAPNTERIVARIASAILVKERLQAEINTVIQRQSIYMGRPMTGFDMSGIEPMPSIPALPAEAPSFAERLSVDDRPRTAPSNMRSSMTVQEKTLELTAAAQSQSSPTAFTSPRYDDNNNNKNNINSPSEQSDSESIERPLAPPLPLVLRPPLRKKKSFSRVSNWLFQPEGNPHADDENSTGSSPTMTFPTTTTTTSPRPVKESDGFYQCVAPPEGLPRTSMETSSSVYTWETNGDEEEDDDEEEAKTVPTTAAAWSPEQTPKQGSNSSRHTTPVIGAGALKGFGEGGLQVVGVDAPRPLSVGVAF